MEGIEYPYKDEPRTGKTARVEKPILKIYIDSHSHYQFKKDGDSIVLLEYRTKDSDWVSCPKMGERGDFKPEEGKEVFRFSKGERVEFIYHSYQVEISDKLIDRKISCGDDLTYLLREAEIADAQK